MALAEANFEEIKKRVLDAYKIEDPIIQTFREYAKTLKNDVRQIRPYSVNAVSFVSADGGDNRLHFNPAIIELVRVVDSRGNQCAIDAIPGNASVDNLNERGEVGNPLIVPPLQKLCNDLNIKVKELSYILGGLGKPGKSTGAIRTYRDIVEWAVLYDLLHKDWGSDTIVVREGLLRTKSFKRDIFPLIDSNIRKVCEEHKQKHVNVSIVGVAKQSAVLSKLAVALQLEETFYKPFPCYVEVPIDIEKACYNYEMTWLDTRETSDANEEGEYFYHSLGKMFLVKFGDRPFDPVWPVDIAVWDTQNSDRIIGQLLHDAQPAFPIPDFPMSVQKAHDFAKVGGIEVEVLQDILFDGIVQNFSEIEKEKVLRIRHLGENLTNRRYKNA